MQWRKGSLSPSWWKIRSNILTNHRNKCYWNVGHSLIRTWVRQPVSRFPHIFACVISSFQECARSTAQCFLLPCYLLPVPLYTTHLHIPSFTFPGWFNSKTHSSSWNPFWMIGTGPILFYLWNKSRSTCSFCLSTMGVVQSTTTFSSALKRRPM